MKLNEYYGIKNIIHENNILKIEFEKTIIKLKNKKNKNIVSNLKLDTIKTNKVFAKNK